MCSLPQYECFVLYSSFHGCVSGHGFLRYLSVSSTASAPCVFLERLLKLLCLSWPLLRYANIVTGTGTPSFPSVPAAPRTRRVNRLYTEKNTFLRVGWVFSVLLVNKRSWGRIWEPAVSLLKSAQKWQHSRIYLRFLLTKWIFSCDFLTRF